MCALLDEALRHGGIGLSTTFMDTDRNNREVPSRKADDVEFGRLLDVVARHPGATLQFVPRFMQPEYWQDDFDRMAALCAPRGVKANWGALRCEQQRADELVARWAHNQELQRAAAHDFVAAVLARARPTSTCTSIGRSCGTACLAWHELANGPDADKERPARRPSVAGHGPAPSGTPAPTRSHRFARPSDFIFDHSERELPRPDRHVARRLRRDSAICTYSDAMADWLLDNGIGSSTAHCQSGRSTRRRSAS